MADDKEDDLRSALEAAFDESVEAPQNELDADAAAMSGIPPEAEGQPRDEHGRWTKAQQEHYEAQQKEQASAAKTLEAGAKPPEEAQRVAMGPPPGWSPTSKAAFATLPDSIKADIAKREDEINRGFAKLQDYKGLEQYSEMARAAGTNLAEAFERYKAAEDALESNFYTGMTALCEMYGVHPMQFAQAIAAQYQGQGQQPQQQAQAEPLIARQLRAIQEEVLTLKNERQQAEQEAINGQLQGFAADKPYFENVRRDMGLLIREGRAQTLDEAYDKACWADPEIRALLIKEQSAPQAAAARVNQARRASGSLPTGSPLSGAASQSGSSNSIRDALNDAWGASTI
jgi:hypothetical protein